MFGRMAPTYDSGLSLFEIFGGDLVAAPEVGPGERVLDIACGRGACLRPAAQAWVVGVECS
jgi:ubiquinone/menaquinone biosynthesis C-methylase UbiE